MDLKEKLILIHETLGVTYAFMAKSVGYDRSNFHRWLFNNRSMPQETRNKLVLFGNNYQI